MSAPLPPVQPEEQLRYARLLDGGTRAGLLVLLASFTAYVLELAGSHVPPQRLTEVWQHPVSRYIELTGSPTGWGWVMLIHRGDIAGLAGIAILAGCSLLCLAALVPLYFRRGDRVYAMLCIVEIAIVVLAASGWLGTGH